MSNHLMQFTKAFFCAKLPIRQFYQNLHQGLTAIPAFPEFQHLPHSENTKSQIIREANSHVPGYPSTYLERQVTIHTCANLYQKWATEKRYWTVPEDGMVFDVRYVDTGNNCKTNEKSPVVVALHGSPGSCHNFSKLTSSLHKSGARIIAPCFPDITTYKMGKFRHTPEEKREYVKDFLHAVGVSKVDLLLCHSSALFTGLLLCSENNSQVESLALLNPTAFDYPRIMRPLTVVKVCSRLFEFSAGYYLTLAVGKLMLTWKNQLKGGNNLDHILSAFTLVSSDVPKRFGCFQDLVKKDFPIMMAFSENDKLIGKKASYEMAKVIANESEMQHYDANGKLSTKGRTDLKKNVLIFEKGTHFVYNKHPEVVADAVSTFLHRNSRSKRMEFIS